MNNNNEIIIDLEDYKSIFKHIGKIAKLFDADVDEIQRSKDFKEHKEHSGCFKHHTKT